MQRSLLGRQASCCGFCAPPDPPLLWSQILFSRISLKTDNWIALKCGGPTHYGPPWLTFGPDLLNASRLLTSDWLSIVLAFTGTQLWSDFFFFKLGGQNHYWHILAWGWLLTYNVVQWFPTISWTIIGLAFADNPLIGFSTGFWSHFTEFPSLCGNWSVV